MRFFFAKKLPNAQARGRRCVCGQCDGNGGVQAAAVWRLLMDQGGPDGPNGQDGRARLRPDGLRRGKPRYTPWVCMPLSGLARA